MKYLVALIGFLVVEFIGWYGGVEVFERGEDSAFTIVIGIIISGLILSTYKDVKALSRE